MGDLMNERPTQNVERVPRVLGEYAPILKGLCVFVELERAFRESKATQEAEGAYLHECVHFLQSIGTTYSINYDFDVMNLDCPYTARNASKLALRPSEQIVEYENSDQMG